MSRRSDGRSGKSCCAYVVQEEPNKQKKAHAANCQRREEKHDCNLMMAGRAPVLVSVHAAKTKAAPAVAIANDSSR